MEYLKNGGKNVEFLQNEFYNKMKEGSYICYFIYFISWIVFAGLVYYQFGITKSYAVSTGFLIVCIGMLVLFGITVDDEINK